VFADNWHFHSPRKYEMKRLIAISLTALAFAACSTNNDVSAFYR
jgi:hypothetical protein